MKITNKQIVEESMVRIEQLQLHIAAIDAAVRCLSERRKNFQIDFGNLRDALYYEEMNEWREMFMWGLTLSDDDRDRIKMAAHQRFLRDGMYAAKWFNNGRTPGSWLSADEAEFRAMVKSVFSPAEYIE
jgi:hypothetical protein